MRRTAILLAGALERGNGVAGNVIVLSLTLNSNLTLYLDYRSRIVGRAEAAKPIIPGVVGSGAFLSQPIVELVALRKAATGALHRLHVQCQRKDGGTGA